MHNLTHFCGVSHSFVCLEVGSSACSKMALYKYFKRGDDDNLPQRYLIRWAIIIESAIVESLKLCFSFFSYIYRTTGTDMACGHACNGCGSSYSFVTSREINSLPRISNFIF